MRTTAAIFLSAALMLSAASPSAALHYCKERLCYVETLFTDKSAACCCEKEKEAASDGFSSESCCHTYILQFPEASGNATECIREAPCTVACTAVVVAGDIAAEPNDIHATERCFPPGGLARYNTDLLTMICIIRI